MQGRRGTLYHVEQKGANGDVIAEMKIRKKFASGNFLFSSAGILQLVAALVLVIAAIIFLTTSSGCNKAPSWYAWLYPLVVMFAAIVTAAIFAFFVLGVAEENPSTWVKVALSITMVEIVAVVVVSILAITNCDSSSVINDVPGPLGLSGAVLLAISAAALFIMWRYRKEESEIPTTTEPSDTRKKSIFI